MKNTPQQELNNLINKVFFQCAELMRFSQHDYDLLCTMLQSEDIYLVANAYGLMMKYDQKDLDRIKLLNTALSQMGKQIDVDSDSFDSKYSIELIDKLKKKGNDKYYLKYFHPFVLLDTELCKALLKRTDCEEKGEEYYHDGFPLHIDIGGGSLRLEHFDTEYDFKIKEYRTVESYFNGEKIYDVVYLILDSAITVGEKLGIAVDFDIKDNIEIFLENITKGSKIERKYINPNFMNVFLQEEIFTFPANKYTKDTIRSIDLANIKHYFKAYLSIPCNEWIHSY